MKRLFIIPFLLITTLAFGATISRVNITPKANYEADQEIFFMVNMTCERENTNLPKVTKNMFIRSRIINCILDDTNTFSKSIYLPEPEPVELNDFEKLEKRTIQLEKFIRDNGLVVPAKVVPIEVPIK